MSPFHPGRDGNSVNTLCEVLSSRAKGLGAISGPRSAFSAGEMSPTSCFCPRHNGNKVYTLYETISTRAKRPDTISGPRCAFSARKTWVNLVRFGRKVAGCRAKCTPVPPSTGTYNPANIPADIPNFLRQHPVPAVPKRIFYRVITGYPGQKNTLY